MEEKEGRFKLRNTGLPLLLYVDAKCISCPSGEETIVSRKILCKPKEHFMEAFFNVAMGTHMTYKTAWRKGADTSWMQRDATCLYGLPGLALMSGGGQAVRGCFCLT